ncbi:MAG TPA: SpoIIE family protein phosphatase, partial [Bacteroidia bacterium]|nr:SpoIIE family protein phosphatase [Bacteroidia bacterium]
MQKKTLSMLEDLVIKRTEEVVSQGKIIEQKNKDITDSIQYAKRLQDAILPATEHISSVFSDNFIFYQPKDIVAGDFFWAHENESHYMIAVADCTGHGVPGAMVSVVCSNALERSVKEYNLTDPGKILDKTTEIVLKTFEKSVEIVNDGMDISLLVVNKNTKEIFWAGANNALYFIQDNQFRKLSPDKQPVGSFVRHNPFTTHTIRNSPDTIFYLLSDGFADQFGGPAEKKFMQKRLSGLLFNSRNLPLSQQNEIVKKTFSDWKGNYEQVDDVTIIGLRLADKFTL